MIPEWIRESEATDARIRAITVGLRDEALSQRHPDGGWSIAEVFEHLCIITEQYLTILRPIIRKLPAAAVGRAPHWQPTFIGGLIARSVDPSNAKRGRAPRRFQPGPVPREAVVERFLDMQRELRDLMQRAEGHDLNRVKVPSPLNRFIRSNLGDVFRILTWHATRHTGQVERIRAAR